MAPWKYLLYGFGVLALSSLINIALVADESEGSSSSGGSSRSWSSGSSSSSGGGWSIGGGGHK